VPKPRDCKGSVGAVGGRAFWKSIGSAHAVCGAF
jgi:hypothetical protein